MFNTTLFEVSISRKKLTTIDNEKLQELVLQNYFTNGRFVNQNDECLDDLNIEILSECQSILNEIRSDPTESAVSLKINDVWVNYNYTDYITTPHTHKNSFLSAVYYPLSTDGQLSFHSPFTDSFLANLPAHSPAEYNTHNATSWIFPVETGDLLIFNSALLHFVPSSGILGKKRMSISYDIGAYVDV